MPVSICICGSMTFIDEMEKMAGSLRASGFQATSPAREERDLQWDRLPVADAARLKKSFIDAHLSKIRQADALLIANFSKHGIAGYIGPNTLMEAAFGYAIGIPVIFLHDPGHQPCGLECVALASGCLDGELSDIGRHV